MPDPRYGSKLASKFINCLMHDGKKSVAQKSFYSAMDMISEKMPDKEPIEIFTMAVENCRPSLEVKSKRVGGLRSYYQYSLSEKLSLFNGLGFTTRRDQSAFSRATEIEFGRDRLTDITLGVNWRFQPKCALRAQWFGSRNDSNIAIYDYSRNEVSSNIRCDFM